MLHLHQVMLVSHAELVAEFITNLDLNLYHSVSSIQMEVLLVFKKQVLHGHQISVDIKIGISTNNLSLFNKKIGLYGIVLQQDKTFSNFLVLWTLQWMLEHTHFCLIIHLMLHLDRKVFSLVSQITWVIETYFWALHF